MNLSPPTVNNRTPFLALVLILFFGISALSIAQDLNINVVDVFVGDEDQETGPRSSSLFDVAEAPTAEPTAVSTLPMNNTDPSVVPTTHPTYFMPVLNITSVEVLRSYVTVHLTIDAVGNTTVYCGAFTNTNAVSGAAIRNQANSLETLPGMAALNVTNLYAVTGYHLYCTAVSEYGEETPQSHILRTHTTVMTPCCREVRVGLLVHNVLSDVATAGAVVAAIDAPTAGTLTAAFDFVDLNSTGEVSNAVLYPSLLQWTPGQAADVVPRGMTLISWGGLNQRLDVTLSGEEADIYRVVYTESRSLTVITVISFPDTPVPQHALFSNDGASVLFYFDAPTDRAGYTNTFPCTRLLTFPGVASASCQWTDSATITIFPRYSPSTALEIGTNITTVPHRIRAMCESQYKPSECSAWAAVPVTNTALQAPLVPIAPTVILSVPSAIDACSPLTVDLTNSVGAAGRPWINPSFQVTATGGSSTEAPQAAWNLQNYLNQNFTYNPPTRVPFNMFAKGFTYSIQGTLCNFLGSCSSGSGSVTVSASLAPVPIVTILGARRRSMLRSATLVLNSNAFTQSCADVVSAANLQYTWVVRRVLGNGAFVNTGLRSASQSPTVFRLAPFALNVSSSYEITLTVTTPQLQSAFSSVVVSVTPANVVAVLQGGSPRYMRLGETLVLDASKSYDQDKANKVGRAAGLSYYWSCVKLSPIFSSQCALDAPSFTSETLELSSAFRALNTTSQITVKVYDGARSSTAEITILVADTSRPKLSITSQAGASLRNINTGKAFALLGQAQLVAPCAASWSVNDENVHLSQVASTATSRNLIPGDAPALFNLVLNAGALPQRASLVFTLTCGTTATSVMVTTNGAPLPGEFLVVPESGNELSTMFAFSAQQWTDADLPLTFQFGFMSETSLSNLVIVSKSEIPFSSTTLPSGLESMAFQRNCTLDVFDNMNAFASEMRNVTVESVDADEKDRRLLELILGNTGSVDSTKNILSVVSTALNAVNCTLAPNCTILHRSSCVRTSSECGPCLQGYIGDAGDRSTQCIPAAVASYAPQRCTVNSGCSEWQECDSSTGTCQTPLKSCSQGCSDQGSCIFVSRTTGDVFPRCRYADIDCDAVCACNFGYSGEFCEIKDASLQTRRAVRSNLIESLNNLTHTDDINVQSVSSWSSSLYSLSLKPHELSENDVKMVAAIANATLYNALALEVTSFADIAGVLQATDTVASLLRYNYNPNDYQDADFSVKRDYENNTAASTVQTVRAFADLVAQSMVLGQNSTNFVYDNFRMSVSLNEASAGNIVVAAPDSVAENVVGVPPSTVSIWPTEGAPTTVAVKVISVPSRSFRADPSAFVSSPLMVQLQAMDGETAALPSSFVTEVEFFLQNTNPRLDYIHPNILNYTTVCTENERDQTFTYVCPESEQIIQHTCTRSGVHVGYCDLPAPGCAKLNVDTAEFAFIEDCIVTDFNSTYTTCSCLVGTEERRQLVDTPEEKLLDDTGAACMVTSTVYIASGFANTFQSASEFNSPEDVSRVLVVLIMMGFIWVSGLLVIFYEGFIAPEKTNKIAVGQSAEAQLRESVWKYVDSVIPSVFKEGGSTSSRIWGEVLQHHILFKLFAKQSARKRRETIFKTMTLFTFMLFLIAIFFDVSNPGDDGTCGQQFNEEDCLKRVSPFDTQQNFCKWNDYGQSCAFNSESMTTQALFYLTVLTTVMTAIANIPIDYLFTILSAPTVRSLENAQVISVVTAVQAGARRMSTMGGRSANTANTPGGIARIAPATTPQPAVSRRSVRDLLAADRVSVVANREIPEEVAEHSESARKVLQLVMKNNESMNQRSKLDRKMLKARSNKQLTRMKSQRDGGDATHKVHKRSKKSRKTDSDSEEVRGAETLQQIHSVYPGSRSFAQLCEEIYQQRLLMNDDAEETKLFDAQWGLVKNNTPNADELYYMTNRARYDVCESIMDAEEQATAIRAELVNYTVQHAGLEILQLFILDLLGRDTPAARIFKEKFAEEFEDSLAVQAWQKAFAWITVLCLNGFFMYYVLLKAFEKGYEWQIQYLACFLLQFAVEVLIFETSECVWLNYSVPSFVRAEVAVAVEKLRTHVTNVTQMTGERRDKPKDKHFLVDVPAHLFVSVKVAQHHMQLLESQIVSCYSQFMPGELSRTWEHYKSYLDERAAQVVPVHSSRFSGLFRALLRGLSLAMTIFVTIPFVYQRVSLRFVQPVLFAGISVVWFFAVGSPIGIGIMCGLVALLGLLISWRWYRGHRAQQELVSVVPDTHPAPTGPDGSSVPTFIFSDDRDHHHTGEGATGVEDGDDHPNSESTVDTGDVASLESEQDSISAGHKSGNNSSVEKYSSNGSKQQQRLRHVTPGSKFGTSSDGVSVLSLDKPHKNKAGTKPVRNKAAVPAAASRAAGRTAGRAAGQSRSESAASHSDSADEVGALPVRSSPHPAAHYLDSSVDASEAEKEKGEEESDAEGHVSLPVLGSETKNYLRNSIGTDDEKF